MKCTKCATDTKKKDRANGLCPSCGEKFAFDPTAGDPLTDAAYAAAIERVSGEGQVKFSLRQLYFEVRRTQVMASQRNYRAALGVVVLLSLGVIALIALTTLGLGLLLLPVVAIGAWWGWRQRPPHSPMAYTTFATLHKSWVAAHGAPKALALPPKAIPQPQRVSRAELAAYSFDRAVITDRDDVVDVLLANRYHFENNCAVLSITGHPAAAFETVIKMLRNNPRIEVYALHDASVPGCELAFKLSTDPKWFQGIGRVIDVGLRPAHAKFFPFAVDRHAAVELRPHPARTADEDAWLAVHTLELAAIRPEQLIKRLFRAMTQQPELPDSASGSAGSIDGPLLISDTTLFGTASDASDGGADSFG